MKQMLLNPTIIRCPKGADMIKTVRNIKVGRELVLCVPEDTAAFLSCGGVLSPPYDTGRWDISIGIDPFWGTVGSNDQPASVFFLDRSVIYSVRDVFKVKYAVAGKPVTRRIKVRTDLSVREPLILLQAAKKARTLKEIYVSLLRALIVDELKRTIKGTPVHSEREIFDIFAGVGNERIRSGFRRLGFGVDRLSVSFVKRSDILGILGGRAKFTQKKAENGERR